ncbi:MAG: reverse transcriptase family protein, partial [Sedimenticola sp.]
EPVRSSRGYPYHLREQILSEVGQMEKLGVIFDSEPMPDLENIFSQMGKAGKRYFSKLDLAKGYWQIPLDNESKEKTAFTTPKGLYQFTVMCFGLVTAPAVFSRMMRKLLDNLEGVDNFIDDIMIFSSTWKEHMDSLRQVFTRLRQHKLTARPTKCIIGAGEIECLGHRVGSSGVCMVPEKVQAIVNAPKPSTKRQVRAFLGLAGFYRKFIPDFASIVVPLTDLTKKSEPNKVVWNGKHDEAFQRLKAAIAKEPVLQGVDLTARFVLQTDASDVGLGAVLLQPGKVNDQLLHPVAYASRKLKASERNFAVVERECLGVVWGTLKFQRYLYGKEFTLQTDHQPLRYMKTAKLANSRLMRWSLLLQPFRFTIEAIKGNQNVGADYLSRVEVEYAWTVVSGKVVAK